MEVLMLSEINQTDKYGIVSHRGELKEKEKTEPIKTQ